MTARQKLIFGLLAVTLPLSACDTSDGIGGLFKPDPYKQQGPDEFSIIPTKPLELPEDLSQLPAPTPGARSRADLTPKRDAVASLGGRPENLDSKLVAGGDRALLAAAARYGTAGNIRQVVRAEDAEYRQKNRPKLLERTTRKSRRFNTYKKQALLAYEELERLRQRGVRTPSVAPPEE